jgi:Family of unknown function (DUF5681)
MTIGRPFQKGQSGNPGGRPKEVAEVKELAREHMPAAINALVSIMNNPKASDAARVSAATALLDRGYGKPQQHIDAEIGFYVARLPRPYDTAEEWAAAVKVKMAMQERPKLDGGAPNDSPLLEAREPDGNNES